ARTPDDFMVAARQVPPGLNAAAISGEYLSAASFLGIAGLVVSQGLGSLWYSVGYTAGYLVLLLLVAAPLRRFGAYTIPDFADGRLGSAALRRATTALVLVIGWFYLLPQMKGAGITLQWVLGTPYWVGVATLGIVVSANIAMGGMKGITFVQCFQYWLKLCAIGIPALVLLFAAGHESTRNLMPDRQPVFARATVVRITEPTEFTLGRAATVTVTGLLDNRQFRHQAVRLCACRHVAGPGTRAGFGAGAPVPTSLAMAPSAQLPWDSPLLATGTNGAHPLVATYGVIIATFFGAIGLPHILVRFYTNPDGEAARRTTLIVVLLLSTFYVFPAILAVLARLRAPELYLSGDSDSIVLALPSLLMPGVGGQLLAALAAAGAFAAFLSTSSGLLVSVAGALSHDFMNGGVTSFRWCAVAAGVVATGAALPVGRFSLGLLVGWAFAIAASSFCPLIVLGIWWRQLTRAGACAGIVVGGGACLAAIVATMAGAAARGWSAVLLGQPAIWTVPLAFGVMIVVSLLTQRTVPGSVEQVMLRMHLPEKVSAVSPGGRPPGTARYPRRSPP
ncbi:MAG: cation acetate symporter, partial [Streptosporangiaceae bacterium]|nr:cation acetate symporter [Streptosporangiaceae bacterium]